MNPCSYVINIDGIGQIVLRRDNTITINVQPNKEKVVIARSIRNSFYIEDAIINDQSIETGYLSTRKFKAYTIYFIDQITMSLEDGNVNVLIPFVNYDAVTTNNPYVTLISTRNYEPAIMKKTFVRNERTFPVPNLRSDSRPFTMFFYTISD